MFILTQAKISLTSVEILTVQGMQNFFPPVNRGSLELQPAHNKPLKQFRPIILIHCEQSFNISLLTINIGSPPSPIEIYGKTPSDFSVGAVADPGAFKEQACDGLAFCLL